MHDPTRNKLHTVDREGNSQRWVKLDRVLSLFDVLKHGDEKHQQWLKDTINGHFDIRP